MISRRNRLVALLATLFVCLPLTAFAQPEGKGPDFVKGQILVKFKNGVGTANDHEALSLHAGRCVGEIEGIGVHIVELPVGAAEAVIAHAFEQRDDIEFAELNYIRPPQALPPNDPYYTGQWNLPKISAPGAWAVTTGGPITIAIVDTGVDGTSPDLAPKMIAGWNIYDNNSSTTDVASGMGHGTLVAGIAAAATNNALGISGVCWGCAIMPVRVSAPAGVATDSNIAAGITWAATHGARVINLGFQVTGSATVSSAAYNAQGNNGCTVLGTGALCNATVVAPAGDFGATYSNSDDPNILEVGATDQNDQVYGWSNKGPFVDLVAPGGGIYTTMVMGLYNVGTGSSYSAPHVTGVAGLVLSINSALRPGSLISLLKQGVDSLGGAPGSGTGRLNALTAVNLAGALGSPPPPVITSATTASGTVGSPFSYQIAATNNPTSFGASGLPGGLSVNTANGLISGSPIVSGNFLVSLTATNAGGTGTTTLSLSIAPAPKQNTSVTLASNSNPSTAGSTVTFTATISPSAATGTVTFFDGGATLGTSPVNGGAASLSTASLTSGSHGIRATYNGDNNYNASTSATLTQTVNPASKINTTTSLASNINPSTSGQSVTFTSTVSPAAATGTVTFRDGATILATVTVSGGMASYTTANLAVGSHNMTANYSGDSGYDASTSATLTQTVNPASKINTTTSLASNINPSTSGQSVTFTSTVSPAAATGTVTFRDGATILATVTVSGGMASYTTANLAAGSHNMNANYSGDSSYNGSSSTVVVQTVNATGGKTNTALTLSSNLNPSSYGQAVTFSATVTPSSATGVIWFFDNGVALGSGTISNGTAAYTTSGLAVGSHPIIASYGGDSAFNSSVSPTLAQTVNTVTSKLGTTTTLASSVNPANVGQSVTLTATVAPSAATGTVTFYDGSSVLGSAVLNSGIATYSTAGLTAGTHTITASYAGNSAYNGSSSSPVVQTINATTPLPDSVAPAAQFLNPQNGSNVSGNVTINASASDNVGVRRMELYIGGVLQTTSATGSLSYRWNARKLSGSQSLEVRAYDAANNLGRSTISVNVVR